MVSYRVNLHGLTVEREENGQLSDVLVAHGWGPLEDVPALWAFIRQWWGHDPATRDALLVEAGEEPVPERAGGRSRRDESHHADQAGRR